MSTEDITPEQDPAEEHAGDHRQGSGAPRRTVRALPPALPRDGRTLGRPGRQRGPAWSARPAWSPGTRRPHFGHGHGHCGHATTRPTTRDRGLPRGLMADKTVTVEVPEDRVPEFYLWFAAFLASAPGSGPPRGGPRTAAGAGVLASGATTQRRAWTADNLEDARWLYGRLSEPARELFDLLIETPGKRHSGNEIAANLRIEKGAHGLAGILAWPGRWCRSSASSSRSRRRRARTAAPTTRSSRTSPRCSSAPADGAADKTRAVPSPPVRFAETRRVMTKRTSMSPRALRARALPSPAAAVTTARAVVEHDDHHDRDAGDRGRRRRPGLDRRQLLQAGEPDDPEGPDGRVEERRRGRPHRHLRQRQRGQVRLQHAEPEGRLRPQAGHRRQADVLLHDPRQGAVRHHHRRAVTGRSSTRRRER